ANFSSFDYVANLTNANGRLFFTVNGGLWTSDGTAAGTISLPVAASNLTAVNGKLFFTATDSTHGTELWVSNGTAAGTVLVKDIYPGSTTRTYTYVRYYWGHRYVETITITTPNSSYPSNLFAYKNRLYFTANDGVNSYELWQSDGTAK